MIVDTHVHVFTNDRQRYPQVQDTPRAGLVPTVVEIGQSPWPETTGETLVKMMDEAGIACATLVQSYFLYEFDNSYTVDCSLAYPDRFAGICVLDPMDPAAPDQLSQLVEQRGIKGIRFMRGRLPTCTLDNPATFPLWQRIADLKIPACIHERIDDSARARPVLEKFPEVKVAFDHGWGHKVGEPPYDLLRPLFDLAVFPNVYVKTAINNMVAAREGTGTPEKFYTALVRQFGSRRIMWSSNYPAHPKFGGMQERLRISCQDLAFLGDEDQRNIFGETALTVWPSLRAK